MSNLAFALAGALMNKERQAEFNAKYLEGLNLGVNAAEPAPLPPDAMPITTPDAYSKFPVGSAVRDILSGIDGIVAAPPDGEFGDVVFITGKEDGKTYAVRFDQVKAIEQGPGAGAIMPPPVPEAMPGAGEEAGLPVAVPAIEPASLKANADKYRAHLRAKTQLARASASINDASLVVASRDDRKLTFKHLKAHLNAKPTPTAKDALAFIGYVPASFDAIWAALVRDGVKVTAANTVFHVEQMVAKGMTASEIKFTVCSSNGGVLGKLIAGMPPTAKPTDPAPAGMTYVWDSKVGEWTTVAAALKPKASEGKDTLGNVVKVSHNDNKAPASGAPAYPVEKNKDEGTTDGGKNSEGEVVKVATQDGKSPASGAPAYPVLDPAKAGGQAAVKAEIVNDSIGKPVEVKTNDNKAPASGAPNYPVLPLGGGGTAPRDKSAADTLGVPVAVKSEDGKSPASGAAELPVLDTKPQLTPNATAPKAEPETEHLAEDAKDFKNIEKTVKELEERDAV